VKVSNKDPAELGKVIKTIFLCRYLHDENLRREIHEGLNVIEQWNGRCGLWQWSGLSIFFG